MHIVAKYASTSSSKFTYLLIIGISLLLFILLFIYGTTDLSSAQLDQNINHWIQQQRTPFTDKAMVLITLLGDGPLSVALIASLLGVLLLEQRWWLATHLLCVYLCTSASVSFIKVLTNRFRPTLPDVELSSFSFPSGHTSNAALLAGVIALLLTHGKVLDESQNSGRIFSRIVFSIACILACLVAFSRVYLSVHWSSDVLAGLALAGIFITAFAWQLHNSPPLQLAYRNLWLLAGLGFLVTSYCWLVFPSQMLRYLV